MNVGDLMTIYLDYIFLENLVINAIIIIIVNNFLKLKLSITKIIVCIIMDTIFCILNYICFSNVFYSIIFSILSFIILFRKCFKSKIEYLNACIVYFIVYILLIGIIILLSVIFNVYLDNFLNKVFVYIFAAVILNFALINLWKVWKKEIKKDSLSAIIRIDDVEIDGFIDTGNTVKDIHGFNVIFIRSNLKDKILNSINEYSLTYVDILTVNGNSKEKGYVVNNIEIISKKNTIMLPKVVLCFNLSSNTPEKYSAIIGYDLYLYGFCGGV